MTELLAPILAFLTQAFDIFLHLDVHLNEWIAILGSSIYLLLFVVVFCETGLVVTPFLPGDSLLFALGAMCATENATLELGTVTLTLMTAAILGDATNYQIGRHVGPRIFYSETSRWLSRKHLISTQAFYERHGGKTVLFARFLPIFRTFVPFVAGIGKMRYGYFSLYNVAGGILWVLTFLMAGYFFGNIPAVKKNFEIVIVSIIFVSCLPMLVQLIRGWRARRFS